MTSFSYFHIEFLLHNIRFHRCICKYSSLAVRLFLMKQKHRKKDTRQNVQSVLHGSVKDHSHELDCSNHDQLETFHNYLSIYPFLMCSIGCDDVQKMDYQLRRSYDVSRYVVLVLSILCLLLTLTMCLYFVEFCRVLLDDFQSEVANDSLCDVDNELVGVVHWLLSSDWPMEYLYEFYEVFVYLNHWRQCME